MVCVRRQSRPDKVARAMTPSLLILSLALAGAPESTDDEAMSALNEHHRHHHHGGITQFVEMSLDTLGEEEAKHTQVVKVQEALHECMEPVEDEEEHVLEALAGGMSSGTVETAKVDAAIKQLVAAANKVQPCVAAPLGTLHKLLSPLERLELGEKVRAHWEVWRHVNVELAQDARDANGGLASVTRELNATPAQVEKMAAALKALAAAKFDAEATQGQIVAFTKAFNKETFDAGTVSTHSTAVLSEHAAVRMATFYETIAPMLTPEQRATLAAHLKEHATHHAAGSP
jgi:Spy/CpxP family protein refolding chaperone